MSREPCSGRRGFKPGGLGSGGRARPVQPLANLSASSNTEALPPSQTLRFNGKNRMLGDLEPVTLRGPVDPSL